MKFRILSLDGGGTWALIQVKALQQLFGEDASGHEVLGQFQLVAANSGGAIVLGGLLKGMTLSQLFDLFNDENQRRALFHPVSLFEELLDPIRLAEQTLGIGPRFSTTHKLEAIKHILGDTANVPLDELATRLGIALPHLLIPAFDYDLRRAVLFRSDLDSLANGAQKEFAPTLANAINASSTAPIQFFDKPAEVQYGLPPSRRRFWDGAVAGYNNPVLAAVVEATANASRYQVEPGSLEVLTIGTASTHLPLEGSHPAAWPILVQSPGKPGPVANIKEISTSILDDPPDAATFDAYTLLAQPIWSGSLTGGQANQLIRLNPLIQPTLDPLSQTWVLPNNGRGDVLDEVDFARLLALDMAAVDQADLDLIIRFCEAWFDGNVPNQPIVADSDLQCVVGHPTFEEASNAWTALTKARLQTSPFSDRLFPFRWNYLRTTADTLAFLATRENAGNPEFAVASNAALTAIGRLFNALRADTPQNRSISGSDLENLIFLIDRVRNAASSGDINLLRSYSQKLASKLPGDPIYGGEGDEDPEKDEQEP